MGVSAASAECVSDLMEKIKTTSIGNRVYHVYSEDEILENTKGIVYPCAGVVYGGLRASEGKNGTSADLYCTVMYMFKQATLSKEDVKLGAVGVLDAVRGAIKGTRAPSGHHWRFELEAPVGGKAGVLAYIQRWSCPIQLV